MQLAKNKYKNGEQASKPHPFTAFFKNRRKVFQSAVDS